MKFKFIEELISPRREDKILNIGIGWDTGVEKILENKVKEMWAADNDLRKIEKARKELKKTKIIFLDAEKGFTLKENYFDKVILLEVLEHLKHDFNALRNINKILKKNGELIISVPTKCFSQAISPLNYLVHYRHYTKKHLTELLKMAGFNIISTDFVGNWLYSINLYLELILKYIFRRKLKYEELLFKKRYESSWTRGRKNGMSIITKAKKV